MAETGLEKETIKGYARKVSQDADDVKYECDFVVSGEFGEIGAILVLNEHHTEMYFKTIALEGLINGTVTVNCNSWVAPKSAKQEKRVFFTNKVSNICIKNKDKFIFILILWISD